MEGASLAYYVGDANRDGIRRVRRWVVQGWAAAVVVRDMIQQHARIAIASIACVYRSFVSWEMSAGSLI